MSYKKALLEGLEIHGQMGLFEPNFEKLEKEFPECDKGILRTVLKPKPWVDLIDVTMTSIEDSGYYEVGYQVEVKSGPRVGLLATGSDYDNALKIMAHKLGVSVDLLNVVEFG